MSVADILKHKGNAVATVSASAPLSDAIALLARENFGALVVLGNDGAVVGILSERDVVAGLARSGGEILAEPVSALMTGDPLTCTRNGRVVDLIQLMMGWNIRHLPVVENRTLLGLVSMGDLVKATTDRGLLTTLIPGRLPVIDEDLPDETPN